MDKTKVLKYQALPDGMGLSIARNKAHGYYVAWWDTETEPMRSPGGTCFPTYEAAEEFIRNEVKRAEVRGDD